MRKKIVAGNWKMNNDINEGITLISELNNIFNDNISKSNIDLIICTPYIHLYKANEILSSNIKLGAQNCSTNDSGAYTGEISAKMIKSTGAKYIIIGHSERRQYYGETDEILLEKVKQCLNNNLTPIFCCGEILKDRENNSYFSVVEKQINNVIFKLSENDIKKIVIAYEPVWAIGTGLNASSQQAQEMHQFIRSLIKNKYNNDVAENISILYGGSCKPSNAKELFENKDVDGGLIGGASLNANDFIEIYKSF